MPKFKQIQVISGTDIKTIEGVSVLGPGNISLDLGSLQSINEGNGIGYRLRGRNPANFGNIGLNSIDFSISNNPSSVNGATGVYSFVTGQDNQSTGVVSSTEGYLNNNQGDASKITGWQNTISGVSDSCHAEGRQNTITGARASHAEGFNNVVSNWYSHAEGRQNSVSGSAAHAEGRGNFATGDSSHVEGETNTASGAKSHAAGWENFARSIAEHAGGQWGTDYTPNGSNNRLFNIGNGTSSVSRNDALTLLLNGNFGINIALPTALLDVNGSTRLRGSLLDFNNQSGTAGQLLSSTGTGVDWIDSPEETLTSLQSKRPLKTINTQSLEGVGDLTIVSGTTSILTATVGLDFGIENDSVVLTIAETGITNANVKGISFMPIETADTSLDDFKLNGVSFNLENIIDNVSFDLRATATNNATGIYTIKYLITI